MLLVDWDRHVDPRIPTILIQESHFQGFKMILRLKTNYQNHPKGGL